ncbi:PulJ/GspJ family protein [Stratiformator vulcanicus]|uniref:Prepilin-type N-terminal cleavage/methylation domain-containing protein n=1 Tax=Stratiformator vulcanicus TaxID=2527980 RepID=A0A517R525_9PLAN|nr:hypothetical protein [Stratiformator vulcanicus]QDT38972.1 hypothetical protein Pan189_33720 [Stratiformator vulcanicus]
MPRKKTGRAAGAFDQRTKRSTRAAFTLLELMIALTVTSGLVVILGGIMTASATAQRHTEGVATAISHGETALRRVRTAVGSAGVYEVSAGQRICGIAVVPTTVESTTLPDTLVVWTGDGSLADGDPLERLPLASELTVFAPGVGDAHRIDEISFPSATGEVDFAAADFAATIRALVASADAVRTRLTDRLRRAEMPAGTMVGALRFQIIAQPTDAEIAAATDEASWTALNWAGGFGGSSTGLQEISVTTELQLHLFDPDGPNDAGVAAGGSLPLFGSASRRYLVERN